MRNGADMKQVELSELLGKPQSYVSKYETGERKLDFVEVANICSVLDYSLQLFCEEYEANIK
jgi:transcriptional regulator with XRE-family HTH domain